MLKIGSGENLISFVHFLKRVPQISHGGGCDSGGGAGKCKSPEECYENLFMSISYENTQTTVVSIENGLNHPSYISLVCDLPNKGVWQGSLFCE